MIEIDHITKSYGRIEVLHDISLSLSRGTVTAIMGPSGSGKSTLLRCVNFLEEFQAGTIRVDGTAIGYTEAGSRRRRLEETEIDRQRRDIGMVFQQFNLFSHMTALENIIEAPIHVLGVPRKQACEEAMQLLRRVGVDHRAHAYPEQMSGGQQQRVAIARALAMKPKLMLFDEPTSALDPESVGEVLSVIKDLASEGMTMLIVTHEIGFARDVADRLIFMDDGRVVADGPPNDLLVRRDIPRLTSFLERFHAKV